MGLTGIFLNVAGRERHGIVAPARRLPLKDEIIAGLESLADGRPARADRSQSTTPNSPTTGPTSIALPTCSSATTPAIACPGTARRASSPGPPSPTTPDPGAAITASTPSLVPGIFFSSAPIDAQRSGDHRPRADRVVAVRRRRARPHAGPVAVHKAANDCDERRLDAPTRLFGPAPSLSCSARRAARGGDGQLPRRARPAGRDRARVRWPRLRPDPPLIAAGRMPHFAQLARTGGFMAARHDHAAAESGRLVVVRDRPAAGRSRHLRLRAPRSRRR